MMRVAHLVENYPQRELAFIHTQIVSDEDRRDIVLAETLMPPVVPPPTAAPVFGFRRSLTHDANPFSAHRGLERLRRKWFDTLGYGWHVRALTKHCLGVLREQPVSLIHAHFGTAGAKAVELKERARLPLVVTFYGADASQCLRRPVWLRRYRRLFAVADRVLVLSEEVVRRLERHGCPQERMRVWDIGLDLTAFGVPDRHARKEAARFLCVARFAEKKGHATLLSAFRELTDVRPGATLTLMGYGPLKDAIAAQAATLGIAERVSIIDTAGRPDFIARFVEALHTHDAFVLASTVARDGDDEGGPALTLVYAQATGLPVVATRFVGVERSVIDGETGLLCAPDNAAGLATRMEELVAAPGLAERLGRAGSELVHERFALPRQRQRLDAIYRELL